MKQTIDVYDFIDAFRTYDRMDNFSIDGLHALFNYLEEYEEDTREQIELDVISLCCDFSEYADLKGLRENYPEIESIDDLMDYTTFISIPNSDSFIIQDF